MRCTPVSRACGESLKGPHPSSLHRMSVGGLRCILEECRPFKDLAHGVYTSLEGVR